MWWKKRGFAMNVVDDWFRSSIGGKMANTFEDSGSAIFEFLNPAAVRQIHLDHVAGRHDHHKILFSLVVLEEWLRSLNVNATAVA